MSSWRCAGLAFRYPGAERDAVDGISLEVGAGACTAVLGPNGSGKSTLLRLLLGVLTPGRGEAWFAGRALAEWSRAAVARKIGVVPQAEELAFPITVRELVAMGRYPHLGSWRSEGEGDRRAIETAMERCDVLPFADRLVSSVSGGERQRARIARALAQEPTVLALDEPTASLDISHEMAIFELVRELGKSGVTVLLSTHNLNLAARYADKLVLMNRGSVAAEGAPAEVVRRDLLESAYRWPLRTTPHPGPGADTGAPQVTPLASGATTPIDSSTKPSSEAETPNEVP